jgi:hypothetical protein
MRHAAALQQCKQDVLATIGRMSEQFVLKVNGALKDL